MSFDTFLHAYRTCILWTGKDDDGQALAVNHSIDDFSEHARTRTFIEARDFYEAAKGLIPDGREGCGGDFWSVRNATATNITFSVPDPLQADILTRMARACGRRTVYINDQGLIEIEAI